LTGLREALLRLAFEPGALTRPERVLGYLILSIVGLLTWLIVWPFIPPLIARLVVGVIDLIVAIWNAIPPLTWPEWLRWPWG
jgi:hypothetical protein